MAFETRGAPMPIVKPVLDLSALLDIIIEKQHFWKLHHWASPGCFLYLHALWTWMWTRKLVTWTWNCILGEFFWREIPLFSNKRRYWKVGVIQKKAEMFDRQVEDRFSETFFSHDTTFSHDIVTTFFETGQPVYYQQWHKQSKSRVV